MRSIANPDEIVNRAEALDRWMEASGYDVEARAAAVASLAATTAARGPTGALTWEDFKIQLGEQYAPSIRSKATRRSIEHCVRVLEQIGVARVEDLDVRTIARLIATRPPELSPNSVRSLLRVTQAICSHAVALSPGFVSPFDRRPIRSWVRASRPKGVRHLDRAQVRAILNLLDRDVIERRGWAQWRSRRLRALVYLVAWTGVRKSEALWGCVEDLDLTQGTFMVASRANHRLKTAGSEKFVICPKPAADVLRDWLENHRLASPPGFERAPTPYIFPNLRTSTPWTNGPSGYKALDALRAVGERAGVPAASFQKLRASVATLMEASGAGAAQIKRQLRHSSVGVTEQHYMMADRTEMARAMENFGY